MSIPFFIITRFNVVLKSGADDMDKFGNSTRTLDWLEHRFEIFERVCLPSMMAQTDADFRWMVLFSDRTPEQFRQRISAIQARFSAFVPCYLEDGAKLAPRFRQEVQRFLRPEDAHVITTRIDNDDAYHREMVARIRAEFHGQEDEFINFLQGLQYDMERNIVGSLHKPTNPFIARIERVRDGGPATVQGVMHHQAEATGLLRDIETKPMWVQSIHGDNVLNQFKSTHILFRPRLAEDFGLVDPAPVNMGRSILALLSGLIPNASRYVRTSAKKLLGEAGSNSVRALLSRH